MSKTRTKRFGYVFLYITENGISLYEPRTDLRSRRFRKNKRISRNENRRLGLPRKRRLVVPHSTTECFGNRENRILRVYSVSRRICHVTFVPFRTLKCRIVRPNNRRISGRRLGRLVVYSSFFLFNHDYNEIENARSNYFFSLRRLVFKRDFKTGVQNL